MHRLYTRYLAHESITQSASNCFTASSLYIYFKKHATLYIRFNMVERDVMLLNPYCIIYELLRPTNYEHDQNFAENLLHTHQNFLN